MPAAGIPLAVVRADLDAGWPTGARWVTSGGVGGAELEQPLGTWLSFPIRAAGETLRLRGRVRLAGGAPGRARARLGVRLETPGTDAKKLWSGRLWRLRGRALPPSRGLDVDFELNGISRLVLSAEGTAGERVRWSGLEIVVSGEPDGAPALASAPATRAAATGEAEGRGPRFSILTPVHDPPPEVLAETLDSVLAQTFTDWQLCLVDDGSGDPDVVALLDHYAAADRRIRVQRREAAGGISTATNAALAAAEGEYVALLDHDDVLVPEALATVERALRERPGTDMVYSDEELFGDGDPGHVFAKPHYSPELLRSQMYTCHLGVYRRSLAESVGGFRSEFDGSQDFDFALRISERSDRIVHIPRVLYRWRVHAASSAGNTQAKPGAYVAARRAIAEHLDRTGVEADVHFGPWQGIYRVVHRLRPGTRVLVGVVGEPESEPGQRLRGAVEDEAASGAPGAAVVFGASAAAIADAATDTDVVVFCEEQVEPLTRHWLARLASFAQQPGVAAVGAKTVAPDGRVELGAAAIDRGLPAPLMFATAAGDPGPLGVGLLPANAAVVGGVVACDTGTLRELGGLREDQGGLALADYCLRALADDRRVVSASDVLLRRTAPRQTIDDPAELAAFRRRWAADFPRDPYFELDADWPGVGSG